VRKPSSIHQGLTCAIVCARTGLYSLTIRTLDPLEFVASFGTFSPYTAAMPETNQSETENLDRIVERTTDYFSSAVQHGKDILAIRSEFLYKLAILDGATLALTFSAATAFHARGVARPLANVQMLLHAYQFLIGSLILSLLANSLFILASENVTAFMVGGHGVVYNFWLAKRQNLTSHTVVSPTLPFNKKQFERWGTYLKVFDRTGIALSMAAQTCTILAFIFLFFFVRANIETF
jgi:hypothetical protein